MRVHALAFAFAALATAAPIPGDREKTKPGVPGGTPVQFEEVSRPGQVCAGWKVHAVEKGDKHNQPVIAPECKGWEPDEGNETTYQIATIKLVSGCSIWKVENRDNYVRPVCGDAPHARRESMAVNLEFEGSIAAAPKKAMAPKGLFKDVQMTIHTLQAQLAQAQHKSQLADAHQSGHVEGEKPEANSDEQNTLQELQKTVQSMQTRLAKARFSVHSYFGKVRAFGAKKMALLPDGIDQGVLQDLQHSVHTLQAQLAQARHMVHAHTGLGGAAKQMAASGLDQGTLQDMQHTARELQTKLSKVRHALHAHIAGRKALPEVLSEGVSVKEEA
ncbi:uncharacterized protein RCC_03636 [Ramularia collo-cygni]|uniref:Uncharacterized protein n=1 Tax=Ramularia collo-cygni TaxID=112498 RepID=A0A2D3UXA8_9PEZI|nr:uncharacterized protein RCC_03636 [Ramularia collo-cygni]CZT17800.1 uncharacterized protein RCC_03636 [Ramularia collo-cygni]